LKSFPSWSGARGFTANRSSPAQIEDRKFVEVNPDNFDTVLEGMKPHLNFSVENKLSEEPDALT